METGTFSTAINCMDGRVQITVNNYIRENFSVDFIDTITLAGPCKIIAEQNHKNIIENIKFRMDISISNHLSNTVFIVGHTDCAAVEETDESQKQLILQAVAVIKSWDLDVKVYGLWVDESWTVQQI